MPLILALLNVIVVLKRTLPYACETGRFPGGAASPLRAAEHEETYSSLVFQNDLKTTAVFNKAFSIKKLPSHISHEGSQNIIYVSGSFAQAFVQYALQLVPLAQDFLINHNH